jgi:hypothetical protein
MIRRNRSQAVRALMLAAILSPGCPGVAAAQAEPSGGWTVTVEGALVSRYIWRGEVLDRANLQPDVHVSDRTVTIGVWSAWGVERNPDLNGRDYEEIDTYLSWDREFGAGELTLTGTDYYFPGPGDTGRFTNFGGVVNGQSTGAHTEEIAGQFTPSAVPVTCMVAWNAYNDPDHSLFAELSSQVSLRFVRLDGDIAFLLKDSPRFYHNLAGQAMEYALRATHSFSLRSFEPYVSAAVVRSAVVGRTYGVFAIGF